MNQEFYKRKIHEMDQNDWEVWTNEHFQKGSYLNDTLTDWLETIYDRRINELAAEFKEDPENEKFQGFEQKASKHAKVVAKFSCRSIDDQTVISVFQEAGKGF